MPAVVRAAICRWHGDGVSVPKVSARWLLLWAAMSWAVAQRAQLPQHSGRRGWLVPGDRIRPGDATGADQPDLHRTATQYRKSRRRP
jgi:hypothetical protein